MKKYLKNLLKFTIIGLFLIIVFIVPVLLLYIGTKESSVDLVSALKTNWTLDNFKGLLLGSGIQEINFRASLFRSIIYSVSVALFVTIVGFFYANWASGWETKKAVGVSFTLLTLILLPQTYLLLPILAAIQKITVKPNEHILIISVLILGTLPLAAWMFFMISAKKIRYLLSNCAMDHLTVFSSWKIIIYELRTDFAIVFLLTLAFAWGNFLVPFSLGSRDSYTAVVEVATFTTNLGRNWAMISAAGFILILPSLVVTFVILIYNRKNKGV